MILMNVQLPRLTSRLAWDRFQSAMQTVLILQVSVLIFPVANPEFCDSETGDSLIKGSHQHVTNRFQGSFECRCPTNSTMHNNNCIAVAGCVNCNALSTCIVDQDVEIIDPNTADVRCQCRGSGIVGDGLAIGNNTCHLFKCDEYTGCAQVPCSTLSANFLFRLFCMAVGQNFSHRNRCLIKLRHDSSHTMTQSPPRRGTTVQSPLFRRWPTR